MLTPYHLSHAISVRKSGVYTRARVCVCVCVCVCNTSYRTYPYESPQLWVEDHKQQRAASLKTLNPGGDQGAAGAQGLPPAAAAAAGAEGGAVHVGVGAHQQGQGGEGAGDGEAAAGEYLPVAYTYEL